MVKIDLLTTIFSSIGIIHNSSSTAILLKDDWFKVHKRVLRNFKILKTFKTNLQSKYYWKHFGEYFLYSERINR